LYINPKIFVRSEDRDFNYEPIFDCLQFIIYKISTIQILTHLLKEYRSKELYDTFDNEIDERKKQ
ncbi:hypothetical protein, partial [Phocaeicola vulgatus]|uniref:hypothetical protein n=1 Tax=Phocaeicola vulgatus TaxID=821 RepID=UPI001E2BC688